jgi:hypothetical protein
MNSRKLVLRKGQFNTNAYKHGYMILELIICCKTIKRFTSVLHSSGSFFIEKLIIARLVGKHYPGN